MIRTHLAVLLTALATGLLLGAAPGHAEEKKSLSAGLVLENEASAKSVGLPIMPGAVRRKDDGDEGSGLTFAAWGGLFGFKIAALQLMTNESAEKTAAYYRKALGEYGEIIDCSVDAPNPGPKKAPRDKSGNKTSLDCNDDRGKKGEYVFKAGKPNNFRLVNVQPKRGQTHINLVRILATD
ncbi:MAG: hypothetical protein JNM76_00410 [Betaproteobacteria bacterium]|nr:hypothetical protein [Betaproteobacteria bacterium]